MVYRSRSGSITFWAWTASIAVHLVILAIFGIVKFSHFKAKSPNQSVPAAKLRKVKELIEAAPVIPKPKIKNPSKEHFAPKPEKRLLASQIFNTAKPTLHRLTDFEEPTISPGGFSAANAKISPKGIEFFGSWTGKRNICYVVDCSGSMQGVFGRVRKELKESITALQPDQYFYIIFFGSGRLFESGKGKFLRATQKAKSAAFDFIESISPAGWTNAAEALEKAVKIRGSGASGSAVVYFLTDGFELTTSDTLAFSTKIEKIMKNFAPKAKINTIGFWPQGNDRIMLQSIAKQSGGEFVCIED